MYKEKLSKEKVLQKLRHYCTYQERCHLEVKDKLYRLGVRKKEHDEIIAFLNEENYLNEERFAMAYAGGKWRIKQWGRLKIQYALKQKQVSDYCIRKAIKQIDEEEYLSVLESLAREKYTSLTKSPYLLRKKKTTDYLIAKGFEPELIKKTIEKITRHGF